MDRLSLISWSRSFLQSSSPWWHRSKWWRRWRWLWQWCLLCFFGSHSFVSSLFIYFVRTSTHSSCHIDKSSEQSSSLSLFLFLTLSFTLFSSSSSSACVCVCGEFVSPFFYVCLFCLSWHRKMIRIYDTKVRRHMSMALTFVSSLEKMLCRHDGEQDRISKSHDRVRTRENVRGRFSQGH